MEATSCACCFHCWRYVDVPSLCECGGPFSGYELVDGGYQVSEAQYVVVDDHKPYPGGNGFAERDICEEAGVTPGQRYPTFAAAAQALSKLQRVKKLSLTVRIYRP